MRKIEQRMVAAVRDRRAWHADNTQVRAFDDGRVEVYLHGHHIATVTTNGMSFTLAGWNTNTTRSRVNALLREFGPGDSGVTTKLGQTLYFTGWYTEGGRIETKITDTEWVKT